MTLYSSDELNEHFRPSQAAVRAVSGDQLILDAAEQAVDGSITLGITKKPRGVSQWTGDSTERTVVLTLAANGGLDARFEAQSGAREAVLSELAAASHLGVTLATWRQALEYIETGIRTVNLDHLSDDPELQTAVNDIDRFVSQAHERERFALNQIAMGITPTQNQARIVFTQSPSGVPELQITPHLAVGRGDHLRVVATQGSSEYPSGLSITMEATRPYTRARQVTTSDLSQALDEINSQLATWNVPRPQFPEAGALTAQMTADLHHNTMSGPSL